jgi:asparagine synthase (glutamine-hydrolysing)
MCGFAGELRFDDRPADLAAVARMSERIAARGPDSFGIWQRGPLALAHRRLTIIDLSKAAEQPMQDPDLGLTLVFNGCIYNYRELRSELEGLGYKFFSHSDSEVLLKGYHAWGVEFVQRLLGMFAFAISERDTGRLILGRDRLGIKPLYLSTVNKRLRFASTLPGIVAAGDVDTSINRIAFHHYMTFHSVVPAPHTILNGVQKLPAATVRVVEANGRQTDHVYWQPQFTRPAKPMSPNAWQEALLEKLKAAVARRMVADVPIGVLLSGGLDSSLIVALLAEGGQRGLTTFSIGFEAGGGETGDEFYYSDIVAKTFDTRHHQIRVPNSRLLSGVDAAISHMSEPMISHDAVAFFLLSEQVAKHVKVVQSGQGADEVFAGYDWYPPLANVPRDQALDAYSAAFFDRPRSLLEQIVSPEYLVDRDVSMEFVRDHFARSGAETSLDAALRIDSTVMLIDDPVKRVDNMTMAWGLEARVPFLDHELVELAAQCPSELKLAHGGKGVLKDAARKLLPAEVIDRPKGYFPVPGIRHLSGELFDIVQKALGSQAARQRGLFQEPYLQKLLASPNEIRSNLGSNVLWQVALLELWLQKHNIT